MIQISFLLLQKPIQFRNGEHDEPFFVSFYTVYYHIISSIGRINALIYVRFSIRNCMKNVKKNIWTRGDGNKYLILDNINPSAYFDLFYAHNGRKSNDLENGKCFFF